VRWFFWSIGSGLNASGGHPGGDWGPSRLVRSNPQDSTLPGSQRAAVYALMNPRPLMALPVADGTRLDDSRRSSARQPPLLRECALPYAAPLLDMDIPE